MSSMEESFQDNHLRFLALEDRLDVFELSFDGVYLWERIRNLVKVTIMRADGLIESGSGSDDSASEYLAAGTNLLTNLFEKNPFFADEHDVLFWGRGRRQLDDGCWWEMQCDPIHTALDLDYLQVERPLHHRHFTPPRTEVLRYLDLIEYLQIAIRKLGLVSCTLDDELAHRLAVVNDELADEFGVEIDLQRIAKIKILEQRAYQPLYRRFLDTVDPDLVLLVKSGGKEPFIQTCQEMGITTVELQHGAFDRYNCNYSFPGDRTKRAFPDFFFAFGDYWHEEVPLPVPDERIVSVGYPYLERKVARFSDTSADEQLLFISQNIISDDLAAFATEFNSQCPDDLRVVYKLHPGESASEHPALVESDIDIIGGNESIYPHLARSRYLVGASSTAVFEGLCFGVEPFLVDFPLISVREAFLERGDATLVSTPTALLTALRADNGVPGDVDHYFEPNALETIADSIDRIRD